MGCSGPFPFGFTLLTLGLADQLLKTQLFTFFLLAFEAHLLGVAGRCGERLLLDDRRFGRHRGLELLRLQLLVPAKLLMSLVETFDEGVALHDLHVIFGIEGQHVFTRAGFVEACDHEHVLSLADNGHPEGITVHEKRVTLAVWDSLAALCGAGDPFGLPDLLRGRGFRLEPCLMRGLAAFDDNLALHDLGAFGVRFRNGESAILMEPRDHRLVADRLEERLGVQDDRVAGVLEDEFTTVEARHACTRDRKILLRLFRRGRRGLGQDGGLQRLTLVHHLRRRMRALHRPRLGGQSVHCRARLQCLLCLLFFLLLDPPGFLALVALGAGFGLIGIGMGDFSRGSDIVHDRPPWASCGGLKLSKTDTLATLNGSI